MVKEKHLRIVIIIIMLTILLSGATILSYLRVPRIYLMGLISFAIIVKKKKNILVRERIGIMYMIWVSFIGISVLYSYSKGNTIKYLLIFLSIFALLSVRFTDGEVDLLLKWIKRITLLYAITIVLAAIITGPFYSVALHFLSKAESVVYSEIADGQYSGLVGDRAIAAYFMNMGLAISLGEVFKGKKIKKQQVLEIILYYLALMMTGKRTLFLVGVIMFGLWILMRDVKDKIPRVICLGVLIIPVVLLLIAVFPQTNVIFTRFVQYSGDDADLFNGRQLFWDFCIKMFKDKPLLGYGFDSFNEVFRDEVYYIYKGSLWMFYAHSIYYELLGETGIIGTAIFAIMLFLNMINTIRMGQVVQNRNKGCVYISLCYQICFILYGITGNCLYEQEQLLFYFLSILLYLNIKASEGRKRAVQG